MEFGPVATGLSMNGICVWHAAFGKKFRASVDCYQYLRNYLIMNALHGISNEALFLARADRTLQLYLRSMAYETADLFVSGFEDYMKGPKWLMASSGESIFKRNNAKAERLVPLPQALTAAAEEYPQWADRIMAFQPDRELVKEDHPESALLKLWRTIPYDRHRLPDSLVKDTPATAYYGGYTVSSPHQVAKRMLVACDRECEAAHVRVLDRTRWQHIRERWARVRADHRERGEQIAAAYREALPIMTSVEYWKDHLGL